MSDNDVKAHAGVARVTVEVPDTPTRVAGAIEGYGPKRLEARVPGRGGRRSERAARVGRIVATAAELEDAATRERVAQALGRVDEWGEPSGDYKRDVRSVRAPGAKGWDAVLLLARALREQAE